MTAADLRVLTGAEDDAWDAFVAAHPLGRGLVTSASRRWWGANGWALHSIGAFEAGRIVAGATLCLKSLPALPLRAARVNALLLDLARPGESAAALLACAESFARRARALEIEVRCRIPGAMPVDGIAWAELLRPMLAGRGYVAASTGDSTFVNELAGDDEALLASLGKKCRRDVRKGQREGVEVVRLTGAEDLRLFCRAHWQTCDRKGLHHQKPSGNYDALLPVFERGHLHVYAARWRGNLMNLALVDAVGLARWELGASTDALVERSAPPTGQVLHFEIMRRLRDQGRRHYDMGGAPGPEPRPDHPNYTVWRFKHEFGGHYVEFLPAARRALMPGGALLTGAARRLGRLA